MSSSYWTKFYYDILDDPKMGRLSDHLWRRVAEIFLMAGEAGNGGYLPTVEDMSWRLRSTPEEVTKSLEEIAKLGIVLFTDIGWFVTNFAKRQDASSNAERQKIYREKLRSSNEHSNESSNEDVTNRYTDKDIDKDIDKDNTAKNASSVFDLIPENLKTETFAKAWMDWLSFRSEIKKRVTISTQKEQLKFLSQYPPEIAIDIIRVSIRNGWQGLFPLKGEKGKPIQPVPGYSYPVGRQ